MIKKCLLKTGYILIPYITLELLQYSLLYVILCIKSSFEISDDLLYIFYVSVTAISGIVFYFWYCFETTVYNIGRIRDLLRLKSISLLILLGIGCQLFFSGIMSLIKPFFTGAFSEYSNIMKNLTAGNWLIVLLLMIFIAPVSEELIFRGVVFHRANKLFGFACANIMQALLFGLYHGNLVQGIYAALIGLILGAVCYKFRTIYASILLHMIINASSLLMRMIPDKLASYIIMMLSGGGFIVIALLLINYGASDSSPA